MLTDKNSALVHELQKERGATAGFVGSNGEKFGSVLKEQRKATDEKLSLLNQYLKDNSALISSSQVLKLIQKTQSDLQKMTSLRGRVDNLDIKTADAIAYYTNLNAELLSTASIISDYSPNSEMTQKLVAFSSFLQGKERAGIERAVLSGAFSAGVLSKQGFGRLIELITEQNTYFASFLQFTTEGQTSAFEQMQNENSVRKVIEYRGFARNDDMNHSSEQWFSYATKRINLLKKIEDNLTEELLTFAGEVRSSSQSTFTFWLVLSLLVTAVTVILSLKIMKGIQSQVATLLQTMNEASRKKNLAERSKIVVQDELGAIATNLNNMLDVFSKAVDTITDSSHQLSTASEESSATVASNAKELMEQQDETLQVVAAIEEMTATIKEVAENTTATADASQEADDIIVAGGDVVKRAVDSINNVSSQVQVAGESINRLHESSNSISAVINVIKGIAEQTNLLALNAAIEAARAGEQGRGFAVVADEVRTLAQRTQESTAEIEAMIQQFQGDSTKAFEQMNESRENVDGSVLLVTEVEKALLSIADANAKISDMTTQIAAATEEQVAVSEDIAQKMHSIGDKSQLAATGGEQISAASHEQAMLATQLQQLASEFKTS
nr:methyl-accepting chemotaxis protein [Alkalimarinus sediminis]